MAPKTDRDIGTIMATTYLILTIHKKGINSVVSCEPYSTFAIPVLFMPQLQYHSVYTISVVTK